MTNTTWHLWRNKLTYVGGFLSLVALLFILGFLFFDLVSPEPSPYVGLFTFLVLPAILVIGLGLTGLGLLLGWRRAHRTSRPEDRMRLLPRIDLAEPAHRRILLWLAVGMLALVPFVGVMSYKGYAYSDSEQFCGQVCHQVMQPQYLAHRHSAHARVECAECHIGRGATWYVKSKLLGVRQVIAVALDNYPRPIPSAITELRPATQTCQQCHWPNLYFGDQLVRVHSFASDEESTPGELQLLVKIGGSDPTTGPVTGIHWHMALGHTIEYVAEDRGLQQIPWIRATDRETGTSVVYRSDGVKGEDPPSGVLRSVDCMDCHNEAAHTFRSPDLATNEALRVDDSLRTLPFAKREMVAALVTPYASRAEGEAGVAAALRSFYEKQHPKLLKTHGEELDRLVKVTQEIYRLGFFPEMNVDWRTYPSNGGHKESAGCFRCHDGRHVDAKGRAVSRDCSICHEFLVPTDPSKPNSPVHVGEFQHPIPLEGPHAELRCDRCHTGGVAPSRTCAGCHSEVTAFRDGTTPAFAPFQIAAEPMDAILGCEDCHDLSRPTDVKTLQSICVDCHGELPEFEGIVQKWKDEASKLLERVRADAEPSDAAVLRALRAAGPLHNMQATRKILAALEAREHP